MGLARGLSTLNTKKRKPKITKARLQELEVEWRAHNKSMKQKGMHDLRYDKFEDYLDYCFGRVKMPDPRDYKHFKPYNETSKYRRETPNYPSLTSSSSGGSGTYKETQKYTGDLIVGIATMHKSNAVPVMKGTSQAEDIAKMRRG